MSGALRLAATAGVAAALGYMLGNNAAGSSSGANGSARDSNSSGHANPAASGSNGVVDEADDDRIDPELMRRLGLAEEQTLREHCLADRNGGERRRLIVVAKTLPIKAWKDAKTGQWQVRWDDARSFLGNLSALQPGMDVQFVGFPGCDVPLEEQDEFEALLEQHNCHPVFLRKDLKRRFFDGFCKGILWPLLHYVLPHNNTSFGQEWDELWRAFTSSNMLFAKEVARVAESPNATIWVHNYHLLLVPAFLRRKLPRAKIGIFLHTPFPSSDVFRLLPSRENLLRGIMSADLVGFQTFDFARHFLSCCKRLLDLDYETMPGGSVGIKYSGRFVSVLTSHVGIDAKAFSAARDTSEVRDRVAAIKARHAGKAIVLGVSDYDLVKGIVLELQAYARFLATHPEWANKVVLIQLILPTSAPDKGAVIESVNKEVESIRARFGHGAIEVVSEQALTLSEATSYYNAAQVAVVSTFWDGLNLSPYEFTVAQSPDDPGALVVSEFMGCSRSLSGVLRVNPWCLESLGEALHTSLSMSPASRLANHRRRATYVLHHNAMYWANNFLNSLDAATKMCDGLNFVQVGWGSNVRLVGLRSNFRHLEEQMVTPMYRQAGARVILFDYDGTLTGVKSNARGSHTHTKANQSQPSPDVMRWLQLLCDDPLNAVFILSGRRRAVLEDWFGDMPQLGLAAEKGSFLRWPQSLADGAALQAGRGHIGSDPGFPRWETLVNAAAVEQWKGIALRMIKGYTAHTDGSWIEDKECAVVWHYENADPEYGRMQASELEKYLVQVVGESVEVVRYDFNRILEVKPRGIGKGYTANAVMDVVLADLRAQGRELEAKQHFLMCIGDDRSDEEMFVAMQSAAEELQASSAQPSSSSSSSSSSAQSVSSEALSPSVPLSAPAPGSTGTALHPQARRGSLSMADATHASAISQQQDNESEDNETATTTQSGRHIQSAYAPRVDEVNPVHADSLANPVKKRLANTFTCCVGIKPSTAHFYLHDHEEVVQLLQTMAMCSLKRRGQRAPGRS